MNPSPPSLATFLLSRRLSPEWREYVLGDLEEEFIARAAQSLSAARRWYWSQAVRCLVAPPQPSTVADNSSERDPFMRTLAADIRYAARVLVRTPSFTLAVIAVLALGIGANTAIFSIVNTVLIRPLPFQDPDRLVRLFHVPPQDAFPGMKTFAVSPANFYDWQRSARQFDGMSIYQFRSFVLTGGAGAQEVTAAAVGAGFFEVARTTPALGRVFEPEEDAQGRRDGSTSAGISPSCGISRNRSGSLSVHRHSSIRAKRVGIHIEGDPRLATPLLRARSVIV